MIAHQEDQMRDKPAAGVAASLNTVRPFCRLVIHLDNITAMKRSTHSAGARRLSWHKRAKKKKKKIAMNYMNKLRWKVLIGRVIAERCESASVLTCFSLWNTYFILMILFGIVWYIFSLLILFFFLIFQVIQGLHPIPGSLPVSTGAAMQHVSYSKIRCIYFTKQLIIFANINLFNLVI